MSLLFKAYRKAGLQIGSWLNLGFASKTLSQSQTEKAYDLLLGTALTSAEIACKTGCAVTGIHANLTKKRDEVSLDFFATTWKDETTYYSNFLSFLAVPSELHLFQMRANAFERLSFYKNPNLVQWAIVPRDPESSAFVFPVHYEPILPEAALLCREVRSGEVSHNEETHAWAEEKKEHLLEMRAFTRKIRLVL